MIRIYFRILTICFGLLLPFLMIPAGIIAGTYYTIWLGLGVGFGGSILLLPSFAFIIYNTAQEKGILKEWVMRKPEPKRIIQARFEALSPRSLFDK